MYTLLKPIKVREELLAKGTRIFTGRDFMRVFQTSPFSTKYFLERQVNEGFLIRLKKGLYSLKTDLPTEGEIANVLYRPSYLSFEYALAYYHLIPEMPYTITSATTKPTRLFTTANLAFSYRTIKKEAFTGYYKPDNQAFLVAEKEKALVDYLYFVSLRKSPSNERLIKNLRLKGYYKITGLKEKKIRFFAGLFKRRQLTDLINIFL